MIFIIPQKNLITHAAGNNVKKNKSALHRDRLSEKRRLINRARKAGIATRMKKTKNALSALSSLDTLTNDELKPVEKLISELNSEIDRAVNKRLFHINTGKRRKSQIAIEKKKILIQKGIFG
jgi:ribosomal protein S20